MKRVKELFNKFITKPEWVFLALVVPFGILSAFLVPQLSVTDENWHFLRAYQVSDGVLVCDNDTVTYPKSISKKVNDARSGEFPSDYSAKTDLNDRENYECGAMDHYLPTMYIPQSIGINIAKFIYPSPAFMVLMARLVNLLFYAAILFFVIKKLKVGKWVLVVIALLPQMVHLAASSSTDMTNNLIMITIIVFLLNLFVQESKIRRSQVITLLVLAVLAAATKQNNVLLFLPLAFLPKRLFAINKLKKIPFNLRKWGMNLAAGAAFSAAFLVFQKFLISESVLPVVASNQVGYNPISFLKLLYNTYFTDYGDVVFLGISNHFSSYGYHFPLIITAAIVILFVIVLLGRTNPSVKKIKEFDLRTAVLFMISFGVSIAAITYVMYTAWASVWTGGTAVWAEGVQGRYFTAMLLLLVPFGIWLQKHISIDFKSKTLLGWIVFAVLLIVLVYYTFLTYKYVNDGLLWAGGYLRL